MIFHSYISLDVIDCYEVELNSLLLFFIGLLLNDTLAPVSLFKGSFSSSLSSTYLTLEWMPAGRLGGVSLDELFSDEVLSEKAPEFLRLVSVCDPTD